MIHAPMATRCFPRPSPHEANLAAPNGGESYTAGSNGFHRQPTKGCPGLTWPLSERVLESGFRGKTLGCDMKAHILQHVPFEGPGSVGTWLQARGASVTTTRLYETPVFPEPGEVDWLVIMGGPMSVNDEADLPWLVAEKRFVGQVMAAGKTVVGICLGAQLIASVAGARVYRNAHKEIGWLQVTREPGRLPALGEALPASYEAFHWHGETFDLPRGAVRLARTEGCLNQMFLLGERVLGVQFHLEVEASGARALLRHCAGDLTPGPYVQTPEVILGDPTCFTRANALMEQVLSALLK